LLIGGPPCNQFQKKKTPKKKTPKKKTPKKKNKEKGGIKPALLTLILDAPD
jgi:hypothetical protein